MINWWKSFVNSDSCLVSKASISLLSWLILSGFMACSPQPESSTQLQPDRPSEIRIGLMAPLTGNWRDRAGQASLNAAELAVKQVNRTGGIAVGGRPRLVRLLPVDEGDNPQQAVSVVRKLFYEDNVVAIVGLPLSITAIPVAQFAETLRLPTISSTSTNPETTAGKQYIFRVAFLDSFQGRVMANFVLKHLKARKAAVLYDVASPYNKGIAEIFKQRFEALGGQVIAFETYTSDRNRDFRTQLKRIRTQKPDVLFLPNDSQEAYWQAQQAREIGMKAIFIGSDGWDRSSFANLKELEGAFYSTYWHPDMANQQAQDLIQVYSQEYGHKPDSTAALTYDALGLIFKAIQNQGKADTESIRLGLSQIGRYRGVSGTLEYQGTGDPVRSAAIVQIKEGKPVFYQLVNP